MWSSSLVGSSIVAAPVGKWGRASRKGEAEKPPGAVSVWHWGLMGRVLLVQDELASVMCWLVTAPEIRLLHLQEF